MNVTKIVRVNIVYYLPVRTIEILVKPQAIVQGWLIPIQHNVLLSNDINPQ